MEVLPFLAQAMNPSSRVFFQHSAIRRKVAWLSHNCSDFYESSILHTKRYKCRCWWHWGYKEIFLLFRDKLVIFGIFLAFFSKKTHHLGKLFIHASECQNDALVQKWMLFGEQPGTNWKIWWMKHFWSHVGIYFHEKTSFLKAVCTLYVHIIRMCFSRRSSCNNSWYTFFWDWGSNNFVCHRCKKGKEVELEVGGIVFNMWKRVRITLDYHCWQSFVDFKRKCEWLSKITCCFDGNK